MSDDPLLNKGELGPYKIEKKLGQGAMGGVYLGMHRVLEVHHAIKVIHPKLLGDDTLLERFLREARNTAKMKHANIVQVVGADKVDGAYYLAMEFVQGKTLEQIMRSPGLSIHDAVRYIHMIANALQYAHSRNIIHRDIKPANIMVNEEDVAKLMDFGLVRDTGQPEGPESGEQLTMAGYIMGTPQYMPLEQWQGEGVDHRSDIYALGATLYVALTGKLPFPGKDAREIFRKVLTTQAVEVRTHNADIDEQLAQVVHTAIAPEKEQRFQKAEEFALALEAWWDQHPYQGTSLFKAPVLDETRGVGKGTLASSSAQRTKPPATPTRAALTMGATGQGSTPTAMAPSSMTVAPGSKAPVFVVVGLALAVAIAIGVWVVFGGSGNNDQPPPRNFKIDIAPEAATQAMPLAVTNPEFSIPGEGEATVNGEPYTFGAALKLKPGLNVLTVAAADGGQEHKLYVLLDTTAPTLAVPDLSGREGSIIPVNAAAYKISGTVSDEGCGLRDLKLTLRIDGDERDLVVNDKGEFERELPVLEADIAIELLAQDRAGNRGQALTFWLAPDRRVLNFEDDWTPANGWVTATGFELKGKLNKQRGARLTVDGQPVEIGQYGKFTARLECPVGRHTIECVAEDWLGGKQTVSREIVVDTEPPELTLTAPTVTEVRFADLPGDVEVAGSVDSLDVVLTVNGTTVTPAGDGTFKTTVKAARYGEVVIEVVATDPADRPTKRTVNLDVKPQLYRILAENEQGYPELERIKDGMVMVAIPGGRFKRGTPAGLPDAPEQEVELTPFLIAKYETTNAQFAKFLTGINVSSAEALERGWIVKNEDGRFTGLQPAGKEWEATAGEGDRPVTGVTWIGAQAYCQWADADNGTLPSEAQWEYAARGSDARQFPWGNDDASKERANFEKAGHDGVVDVAKKPAGDSSFGVRLMCGNVEEWCLDWYEEGAYRLPGQQGMDPALTTRPGGVDRRVTRGGSYLSPYRKKPAESLEDEPGNLQSYARARRLPDTGSPDRGFRAAARMPAELPK